MNSSSAYLFLFCLLISCNTNKKTEKAPLSEDQFAINGICTSKDKQVIYLFVSKDTSLFLMDSVQVVDNKFQIKGAINHPYKAFLKLKDELHSFPFILTNESIEIALNKSDISKSTLTNSIINTDLAEVQKVSSAIFQKIDYLFPRLQKARMENDFESLNEINDKIDEIEKENVDFLHNYVRLNPKKELSGLLLNDLWNSTDRDSIQLLNLAKIIAPEIKRNLNFSIH